MWRLQIIADECGDQSLSLIQMLLSGPHGALKVFFIKEMLSVRNKAENAM